MVVAPRLPTESRPRPRPRPRITVKAKAKTKDFSRKAKNLDFGLKDQGLFIRQCVYICFKRIPSLRSYNSSRLKLVFDACTEGPAVTMSSASGTTTKVSTTQLDTGTSLAYAVDTTQPTFGSTQSTLAGMLILKICSHYRLSQANFRKHHKDWWDTLIRTTINHCRHYWSSKTDFRANTQVNHLYWYCIYYRFPSFLYCTVWSFIALYCIVWMCVFYSTELFVRHWFCVCLNRILSLCC